MLINKHEFTILHESDGLTINVQITKVSKGKKTLTSLGGAEAIIIIMTIARPVVVILIHLETVEGIQLDGF